MAQLFVMLVACGLAMLTVSPGNLAAQVRDHIYIAGSSTVLPYAAIVAQAFAKSTDFPSPMVESGGSSAGLRRFCEGVGNDTIDIANASRPIRASDLELCASNGVNEIIEVRIGYDGIVFASNVDSRAFAFTPADWYLALAARLPVDGEMIINPYSEWQDIRAELPEQAIAAFIPGVRHGTRDVFEEKVILQGCKDSGAMAAMLKIMDTIAAEDACIEIRADGLSTNIDGDYTDTLAQLKANADGVGVFGLAFYENNAENLNVATMSGVAPSTETIASGEYPVSRPLFFYLKAAHLDVIPGLQDYAAFFVSDTIAGPDGVLTKYGLVANPALAEVRQAIAERILLDTESGH